MGLVVLPNKATDSLGKQKNLGVHSQVLNVWHDVTITVGSVMPLNHGHRAWRSQVESDLAPMSQDRCAWCVGSELQLGFTLTPPAYPLGPRERPAFCDRWPQHESHAEVSPHISGLTCQYLLAEQATLPNPGWTKDGVLPTEFPAPPTLPTPSRTPHPSPPASRACASATQPLHERP